VHTHLAQRLAISRHFVPLNHPSPNLAKLLALVVWPYFFSSVVALKWPKTAPTHIRNSDDLQRLDLTHLLCSHVRVSRSKDATSFRMTWHLNDNVKQSDALNAESISLSQSGFTILSESCLWCVTVSFLLPPAHIIAQTSHQPTVSSNSKAT